MIFVDSNIPMYVIGSDERMRAATRHLLERAISSREKLVTSAESYGRGIWAIDASAVK